MGVVQAAGSVCECVASPLALQVIAYVGEVAAINNALRDELKRAKKQERVSSTCQWGGNLVSQEALSRLHVLEQEVITRVGSPLCTSSA